MLHYTLSGNGKENLVLLHGFMENSFVWEHLEENLSKSFKIVKIDLPGHGQSKIYSEIHSMELMAEKVNEVLEKLNISNCHILGHSMGGYVSLAFAELFPEKLKSITLFFSSYLPDTEEKKNQRKRSFRIIKESFKTYVNAGVPILFNALDREKRAEEIQLTKEIALSTSSEGVIAAAKGMMTRKNQLQLLNDFKGKVVVIAGKHDSAVDSYHLLQHLPTKENIKTYLLDCGHNGHFEKPIICASIINEELLG